MGVYSKKELVYEFNITTYELAYWSILRERLKIDAKHSTISKETQFVLIKQGINWGCSKWYELF